MPTVAEVQQLISEHQTKLDQIQSQFDDLARQIAAAEVNGGKNIEELREQQFNCRFDVKHEEETLNYLQGVLVAAKRDEAIEEYRQFLEKQHTIRCNRNALKARIDELEAELKPLKKEYEDGWQNANYWTQRSKTQHEYLAKEYGVSAEELDAIKSEVVPVTAEAESG